MNRNNSLFLFGLVLMICSCQEKPGAFRDQNGANPVTVPIVLDHNRMLVDAEMQRADGTWRRVHLWVDTGNPEFFLSRELAQDLGIDLVGANQEPSTGSLEVAAPTEVRIGGMKLDFEGVKSRVLFEPRWLFTTMHNDANLPASVLKRYQVIFDYPGLEMTLAEPGTLKPRGISVPASIDINTGIVQMDAIVAGDSFSFALDNGASYSFTSEAIIRKLARQHPAWSQCMGALGCANIWGWWPQEASWQLIRVPEIMWGSIQLENVGLVGLPNFFHNGIDIGAWYSHKTARPVAGILGPNAFKAFRIEIDYGNSLVYFEKKTDFDANDQDMVGLTLRPEADGSYRIIAIAQKHGRPAVEGVQSGDILLQVDDFQTTHATMGAVVDALRGKPGARHTLVIGRNGHRITINARVEHFL